MQHEAYLASCSRTSWNVLEDSRRSLTQQGAKSGCVRSLLITQRVRLLTSFLYRHSLPNSSYSFHAVLLQFHLLKGSGRLIHIFYHSYNYFSFLSMTLRIASHTPYLSDYRWDICYTNPRNILYSQCDTEEKDSPCSKPNYVREGRHATLIQGTQWGSPYAFKPENEFRFGLSNYFLVELQTRPWLLDPCNYQCPLGTP